MDKERAMREEKRRRREEKKARREGRGEEKIMPRRVRRGRSTSERASKENPQLPSRVARPSRAAPVRGCTPRLKRASFSAVVAPEGRPPQGLPSLASLAPLVSAPQTRKSWRSPPSRHDGARGCRQNRRQSDSTANPEAACAWEPPYDRLRKTESPRPDRACACRRPLPAAARPTPPYRRPRRRRQRPRPSYSPEGHPCRRRPQAAARRTPPPL